MDDPNERHKPTKGEPRMRLLSSRPLGRVSVCSEGCLHIDTKGLSLRLTRDIYVELVEMLSEAAAKLSPPRETVVH